MSSIVHTGVPFARQSFLTARGSTLRLQSPVRMRRTRRAPYRCSRKQVKCVWGCARWSRTQLLGELARGQGLVIDKGVNWKGRTANVGNGRDSSHDRSVTVSQLVNNSTVSLANATGLHWDHVAAMLTTTSEELSVPLVHFLPDIRGHRC
eukprot:gene865-biopygen9180